MPVPADAALDLVVDRTDLRAVDVVPAEVPDPGALAPGTVLLEVERFGFSANNVTYAALGEAMGYWRFFPRADGRGRIPVWGYARVLASAAPGLAEDERVFGYLPLATHAVLEPGELTPAGFVDTAPHRAELPPVYQRYGRLGSGPGTGDEDLQALWRPLLMTSFGAADHLAESALRDAARVVLSSASSKTAMGIAGLLRDRDVEVAGLTSARHVGFCEEVGYYDTVLAYEDLERLPTDGGLVLVDLAGDARLLAAVRAHAGDALRRTVVVGVTHWDAGVPGVPGVPLGADDETELFFLPTWLQRRQEEWGPGDFGRRYGAAQAAFLPTAERWMRIERHEGPEAVQGVVRRFLDGDVDPAVGHVLSLHD